MDVEGIKQEHQLISEKEQVEKEFIQHDDDNEHDDDEDDDDDDDQVEQQHIMTVVNSHFETMPLGLSQDIPDVRL